MAFAKQESDFELTLLKLLTLLLVLVTATAAYVELDPFIGAQNPCSQIRNAQFICVDCQTYGFCSQVNGAWVTAEVGKCDGFLYCNEDARGCSYSQECKVPQHGPQFECQNPGIYPDPYDCKYYHECSERNEHTTHVCGNGLGYAVVQGTCSLSKQSKECKNPQFECKKAGQVAAWESAPNIYYICISKNIDGQSMPYPLLYRCPVGHVFADEQCVLDDGYLPVQTTDQGATCKRGSLVRVSTDCHSYKRCGDSISVRCPLGTRFDEQTQKCVHGNC